MDDLLNAFPKSSISFVGIAVILFLLRILWTLAEEWAKTLYRNIRGTGKEKRHEVRLDYNGLERRSENKGVESAIMALVEQIKNNNTLIERFIENWKERVPDAIDAIDEIKRKQDNNWQRLFNDELPSIRRS